MKRRHSQADGKSGSRAAHGEAGESGPPLDDSQPRASQLRDGAT
ncbi:hypothetical protein [Gimesia panareensis]|nr:hypothetical protein [Gimesia panareensis]